MTVQIMVPTLGESVTEATVAKWLKKVGDVVAEDEPVVELETDKVSLEVPSPSAGVLSEILVFDGTDVPVGAVLGSVEENGVARTAPPVAAPAAPAPAAAPTPKTANGQTVEVTVPSAGESVTEGTIAKWFKAVGDAVTADEPLFEVETDKAALEVPAPASGTLVEIRAEEGEDVTVGAVVAIIAAGSAAAAPVPKVPAIAAGEIPALSPAVRKLVEEHGIDPARIPATGPKGRLTKGDVLTFIRTGGAVAPAPQPAPTPEPAPAVASAPRPAPAARPAPPPPAAPVAGELPARPADPRGEERVRMSRLRQRIAQRLKEAQNSAAMLTTYNEVRMDSLMKLRSDYRDAFEKKHGVRLGFLSFFVKASIIALQEIPAINAEIYGDEIIYKNFYDIGVAVGTPQGLVVPVLRDADLMSFAEIEGAIADFGRRARDGKLSVAEMTGGTFTISNGGVYGSLMSMPILNPPQSGILGMHKIQKRPIVDGDEIVAANMMYLALTYDHRIVDGREAVTFLVRLKEVLEDPQRLLIDV